MREKLCPHWNGLTQLGDAAHASVGKGEHAPVAGITGCGRQALGFARQ